jgi:DNA invertase Pin-like site-specific DNA recombinase
MQNTDEPTVSHLDSDLLVALVTPGIFKDAVISIMATIAKQENIRRSERIVAGLQRAKRNGSRLGRPHVSSAKASRTTLWRRRSQ